MHAAGSLSPGQIIVILIIVLLLFGGKRLRSFGSDLGEAIKGFKNSMGEDKDKDKETKNIEQQDNSQNTVQQNEKNEHKQ